MPSGLKRALRTLLRGPQAEREPDKAGGESSPAGRAAL